MFGSNLLEGTSEEYRTQFGEIVYQTLVDVLNVRKGDRFQMIAEQPFVGSPGLPQQQPEVRPFLLALAKRMWALLCIC